MKTISLRINREQHNVEARVGDSLLTILRKKLRLTGTKESCGEGHCGACTVLLDGKPVNSCLVLAVEADGKEVVTIEGLASEAGGELLQSIVEQHGAVQCGFCSAGMLLSVWSAVSENPGITDQQLREALAGNLCRCGTHPKILEAAASFRESLKQSAVGNRVIQQEAR